MNEFLLRRGDRKASRATLFACLLPLVGLLSFGCARGSDEPADIGESRAGLLASGSVDISVAIPSDKTLSDIVLGASSGLLLTDGTRVDAAGSALPMVVNTGTSSTTIGAGSQLASNVWSRASVALNERASVSGSLTTAGTLTRQSGTTVGGTILQHQTLSTRNVTFSLAFPASSTDVSLEPNTTSSISPGAFSSITVKSRATLHVASGTYYVDSFDTEPLAQVLLEGPGPFVFNVRSNFTYKAAFSATAQTPFPAVLVADAGTSDVFLQSAFTGTLIAPRANVTFASGLYQGSFFGKLLTLQTAVHIVQGSVKLGSVQPIAECRVRRDGKAFATVFGYQATTPLAEVTIPIGPSNQFLGGAQDRGQPRTFTNGRNRAVFAVESPGDLLTWELDGKSSAGSRALPECTAECVQQLFDPSKPRIAQLLSTSPAPLSRAESILVRDAFSWDDTLPVPELGPDGFPRLYYGQVFVDSRSALDGLDVLRVHYSATPLFEEEMLAIDQLDRTTRTYSYDFDGQGQFVFAIMPGAVYNAIRASALDPTEPAELFRAFQVRTIPIAAAKTACGLAPKLECVAQAANGALSGVFGYDNPEGNPVTIPASSDNALSGVNQPPAPPEAFAAGRHTAVFSVPFATNGSVTWSLNGQSVSARSTTPRCTAAQIASIGVDKFKPFAPPASGICRERTPGEAQFPGSQLPPSARVNTCTSFSYNYAGQVGMQWRGVADGEVDTRAEAVEAELDATDNLQPFVSSDPLIQAFSLGKIFRKAVKAVVSVGKGAVDLTRQGLTQVGRLFVGSRTVTVAVEMENSDVWFRPTPNSRPTRMERAWKASSGIQIPGVEVRASYGPFLSLGHLDSNNKANVRVLNGLGARVCFTAENGAIQLENGWFLPPTQCDYTHPADAGQDHIPGSGPDPATGRPIHITDGYMNVLAQATDAHDYMSQVAGFNNHKGEVIVGGVANLIGEFNDNRAFTPCFSFSWANDATLFLAELGAVAGNHVADFVLEKGSAAARSAKVGITSASSSLADAATAAGQATTALAQTALATEAQNVQSLIAGARAAADSAALATLAANQAADDARDAIATLARLSGANSSRVAAAKALADAALDAQQTETAAAKLAIDAAGSAANAANAAATQLAIDAVGTAGQVATAAARDSVRLAGETLGNVSALAITAATQATAAVAQGSLTLLGYVVGQVLGPVFDFFAGGDMIMTNTEQFKCDPNPTPPPAFTPPQRQPPGTCFLTGDPANHPTGKLVHDGDPEHSRALVSRRVATHEYGHYTLCNLLERVSPSQFAQAYNEAAADGLLGQTPEKQHVVFNEAFADLIDSQVASAVDYATPIGGLIPDNDPSISRFLDAPHYCPSVDAAGNRLHAGCIENNFSDPGASGNADQFTLGVSRMVTLFNDALDGACVQDGVSPNNGKAWRDNGGRVALGGFGFSNFVNEEVIHLPGAAIPRWIRLGMARGTLLREDNMFGGLNDVMLENGVSSWCQRCQLFRRHQADDTCPERWVGPRPAGLVCADEEPLQCNECSLGSCTTAADCGGVNGCVNGCCVIG